MVKNQDKPRAVQVNPEGHVVIDHFVRTFGVEKAELVTRVLVWFGKQSAEVQRAILDPLGDAASELVKLKLAEATSGNAAAMDLRQTAAAARAMLDRLVYIAEAHAEPAEPDDEKPQIIHSGDNMRPTVILPRGGRKGKDAASR